MSEHLRGVKPSLDSSSADDDAEPVAPVAAPDSSSDARPRRSGRSLRKIEEELAKRAKDAAEDGLLTASQAWQHPDSRMSAMIALGNWVTQKKLQRALTHERLKTRFIQFWDGLADKAADSARTRESKSVARVRFRKVLNSVSHIPLAVFPSQGLTMRDPHYVWYLKTEYKLRSRKFAGCTTAACSRAAKATARRTTPQVSMDAIESPTPIFSRAS